MAHFPVRKLSQSLPEVVRTSLSGTISQVTTQPPKKHCCIFCRSSDAMSQASERRAVKALLKPGGKGLEGDVYGKQHNMGISMELI